MANLKIENFAWDGQNYRNPQGQSLWVGTSEGGWGNGPYRQWAEVATSQPQNEVVRASSNWREDDLRAVYRPLCPTDSPALKEQGRLAAHAHNWDHFMIPETAEHCHLLCASKAASTIYISFNGRRFCASAAKPTNGLVHFFAPEKIWGSQVLRAREIMRDVAASLIGQKTQPSS